MSDAARAWVETLRSRGVTLTAHGKKGLALVPKSAFGEMSAEERMTLKAHKATIVALVREGANATPVVESQAAPVEPPVLCRYCSRAPCIGVEHHAFAVLHQDDPRVIEARRKAATKEMMARVGKPHPWDY